VYIYFFDVLNGTAPVSGTQCTRITATLIDRGYLTRSLCAGVGGSRRRWLVYGPGCGRRGSGDRVNSRGTQNADLFLQQQLL